METNSTLKGIKNSWSLLAFVAKMEGKLKVAPFMNEETGETFKSCVIVNPEDNTVKCFIAFSSKLGELTPAEIKERKRSLQVVELESGTYKLCESKSSWEDVDL